MSDSPLVETPQDTSSRRDFKILFLAASVYEFNIDRSRQEAGYPYLVYRAGEVSSTVLCAFNQLVTRLLLTSYTDL